MTANRTGERTFVNGKARRTVGGRAKPAQNATDELFPTNSPGFFMPALRGLIQAGQLNSASAGLQLLGHIISANRRW
jgi:hypothetical protein